MYYDRAELRVTQWEADNPKPTSKRGIKRWSRKFRQCRDEVNAESWQALLEAERHFMKAQGVVAKIEPADANELGLMAMAAVIYDATKLVSGRTAVISYAVTLAYAKTLLGDAI